MCLDAWRVRSSTYIILEMHSGNFGYTIWKLWEYNQISLRDMRNQFNTFPNPQTGEKPAREIQFPLEHKLVRIFFQMFTWQCIAYVPKF